MHNTELGVPSHAQAFLLSKRRVRINLSTIQENATIIIGVPKLRRPG